MTYCLWCDEQVEEPISWHEVFGLTKPSIICSNCRRELEVLPVPLCDICGRSLAQLEDAYKKDRLCYDCVRWEESEWSGILRKNRSLYGYNAFLKERLSLFKFRGDAAVAKGFASEWQALYEREFKDLPIVPIPLSSERLYERGFNQSVELARLLPVPYYEQLRRTIHEKKQSKKSRLQRLRQDPSDSVFQCKELPVELLDKEIVLIDDIYTTGSTLRRAAKALMDRGATSVSSLTVARG